MKEAGEDWGVTEKVFKFHFEEFELDLEKMIH